MTRNEAYARTEIRSENEQQVVYLDGKPVQYFCWRADDYAFTNAREYRDTLVTRIMNGETT